MARRAGRILRVALVVLVAVVVLAGGVLGWVVLRGFPQRAGTAHLQGLSADVTVLRDASGIPQIYATTSDDLFAAQGYVHASERMWQMEVWRHVGAGRLSELFGSSQVDTDRFVRTLGWRGAAEADLQAASPDARRALEAYARGVNAWLAQHGDGSLPFVITGLTGAGGGLSGYRPEPWTPLDSVTWAKVQAWSLGGNMDSEILNMLLAGRVDSQALAELHPTYRVAWPVVVPTGAKGSGGAGAPAEGAAPLFESTGQAAPDPLTGDAGGSGAAGVAADAGAPVATGAPDVGELAAISARISTLAGFSAAGPGAGAGGVGSNDWVVGPSRSASGHPILANDPHLAMMMPSIWYLAGLHCRPVSAACPYDVVGVGFPGTPGIVLGHNARIAWGFTNVNPDVQDLFAERVDPADPDRYMYQGQQVPFATRDETIKVAGAADVSFRVRSTVHGPVISDAIVELEPADRGGGQLGAPGVVYALRWTGTAAVSHILDAILQLDRASDFPQFRDALRGFDGPSQNVVYADVDGHIGYQMPGLIPIRRSGDGSLPAPGWDGSHDWIGYVPFEKLPYLYDPPSGVIVTANNATVDARFPAFVGREWSAGFRAQRILQLIEEGGKLTPDAVAAIQGDVTLLSAQPFIDAVAGAHPISADAALVRDRIGTWDARCTTDSPGCAAYHVFVYHLARDVFDPRLGSGSQKDAIARMYVGSEDSFLALSDLLDQPASRWWDDPTTPPTETREGVIARALEQTGADLRFALGDPSGWTWGAIHTLSYREPTLGTSGIGPLEWAFDRGPYPAPGAPEAVDQMYFDVAKAYPDPYATDPHPPAPPASSSRDGLRAIFDVVAGPSYRLVVDMGDLDGARAIQTTGQSGVPFDTHYGDLAGDYLGGTDRRLPFSRAAVERVTTETLTLTP
jgi:penicillin amidase